MTGDDATGDLVAVAQALTVSLDGLTGQVGTLNAQVEEQETYGRRNRRMIWGLVASLVLDVILTVVIVRVSVQANNASDQATRAHDQQVSTCVSTNAARENNKLLWDKVFSLTPSRPQPEKQQKQLAEFKAFVEKTFAPRDCSKI